MLTTPGRDWFDRSNLLETVGVIHSQGLDLTFGASLSAYKRTRAAGGSRDQFCTEPLPAFWSLLSPFFFHHVNRRSPVGAYSPPQTPHHHVVDPIYHSTISRWTGKAESLVRCTCASLGGVATCGVGSDQIARRRRLVRLHHPHSVEHFCCMISSSVWRSHLSISLITSPRLDLGFLVRIRRIFFDLLCCESL
jgi:hypothetical protein